MAVLAVILAAAVGAVVAVAAGLGAHSVVVPRRAHNNAGSPATPHCVAHTRAIGMCGEGRSPPARRLRCAMTVHSYVVARWYQTLPELAWHRGLRQARMRVAAGL